ncbi:MAG: MBL fold metallo-hydrolase [bacterium]
MNSLHTFVVGSLEENCYLLFDEDSRESALIDPGAEAQVILSFIANHNLLLKSIILTHGHGDHIGAVGQIKEKTKALVYIHQKDAQALGSPRLNLSCTLDKEIIAPDADFFLDETKEIKVGSASYKVIHTPGHTIGGICLYGEGRLFSGDTLFLEGIGRSDLWNGDGGLLIRMIKEKLFTLPGDTKVYPGHGPETTIGWEKEHNPFD